MKALMDYPQDGIHTVIFYADGDRPILKVFVDENDDLHQIYVQAVNAPKSEAQPTKGVAKFVSHVSETGVQLLLDPKSVINYVVPRIVTLMARVYVPKNVTLPN